MLRDIEKLMVKDNKIFRATSLSAVQTTTQHVPQLHLESYQALISHFEGMLLDCYDQ